MVHNYDGRYLRLARFGAALVAAVLLFAACSEDDGGAGTSADAGAAVATVNGTPISEESVTRLVAQMRAQGSPDDDATLREQAISDSIDGILLYQHAVSEGIDASDVVVEQEVTSIREQFDDEESFVAQLEAAGYTVEGLTEEVRIGLSVQALYEEVLVPAQEIGEEELQAFYDDNPQYFTRQEQVRARHILIDTQELETDEELADARRRAEEIRAELVAGADFVDTAIEKSEGPSAPNGGDLGLFGRGQMVAPFEEAAFSLDVGEISDLVETQFGYHIILVEEKVDAGQTPLDDVAGDIESFLRQSKASEAAVALIDDLRAEATIERLDGGPSAGSGETTEE